MDILKLIQYKRFICSFVGEPSVHLPYYLKVGAGPIVKITPHTSIFLSPILKQIDCVSDSNVTLSYDMICLAYTIPYECCFFASLLSYSLMLFSRKRCLLLNNLVAISGALIMLLSKTAMSFEMIMVGRFIYGINAGKTSGPCCLHTVLQKRNVICHVWQAHKTYL